MFVVFLRTIILYVVIVFALRFMGKRQIGELQPSELVITILISNIASLPIEDTNIPLIGGIIPILVLICFEVVISAIAVKSNRLRSIVTGQPRIVIEHGKVNQKALKDLRLTINDLMEELRAKNIFDVKEVSFAIVETNGTISVYQKQPFQKPTNQDMGIKKTDAGPPIVVISDGCVIDDSLRYCKQSREWVEKIAQTEGGGIKHIFLMTVDPLGNYNVILKEP